MPVRRVLAVIIAFIIALLIWFLLMRSPKTSLNEICRKGDVVAVKEALASNPGLIDQKDESGNTPLLTAALAGHKEVIQLLVDKGANTMISGKDGRTALDILMSAGKEESALALVSKSNPTDRGVDKLPLLHRAALAGMTEMVSQLSNKGGDIDLRDDTGRTPLMLASDSGSIATVKALLEKSAKIETKDSLGMTALHHAAKFGNADLAAFLIEQHADISAEDKIKATPLHTAAAAGATQVIDLLISKGAKVNVKDSFGTTPLAQSGERRSVQSGSNAPRSTSRSASDG